MLPIYATKYVDDITGANGQMFKVMFGLDQTSVNQFTRRSCDLTDTELQKFTTDYKRICQNGYASWYAKERYPFALLDAEGALAGIIWFGPKAFPPINATKKQYLDLSSRYQNWHTFAIRMYPPYRGQRLAFPFADFVFKAYAEMKPEVSIWLDTQNENLGAIGLYKKLGFVECGQKAASDASDDGRLVMARL